MPAYAERPPLSQRQQSEPWGTDGRGAMARLTERIDQQQQEIHRQARAIRQLRDALALAERRERLLRERLARKRSNRRRRPDPAQLSLL